MRGQPIEVIWSTRAWAEAIASLPASDPLPCRTVLVPRERIAHALSRDGELWRLHGPTIAAIASDTSGAEAAFVRAIPNITLALHAARPVRAHHVTRMTSLLGSDVAGLLSSSPAPHPSGDERN